MKKLVITVLVIMLPVFLFVTVWQSYRHDVLSAEVAKLEQTQKEMFEKNKKIVMGIEFLKSPFRIDGIAEDELKLEKIDPERVIRIQLPDGGERGDG